MIGKETNYLAFCSNDKRTESYTDTTSIGPSVLRVFRQSWTCSIIFTIIFADVGNLFLISQFRNSKIFTSSISWLSWKQHELNLIVCSDFLSIKIFTLHVFSITVLLYEHVRKEHLLQRYLHVEFGRGFHDFLVTSETDCSPDNERIKLHCFFRRGQPVGKLKTKKNTCKCEWYVMKNYILFTIFRHNWIVS